MTIRFSNPASVPVGVLLTGMGSDESHKSYFDHIVLNASQVTNPSIDPLREPMELKTYIGRKPGRLDYRIRLTNPGKKKYEFKVKIPPQMKMES